MICPRDHRRAADLHPALHRRRGRDRRARAGRQLAGSDAPLAVALKAGAGVGEWAADILSVGALIAITSVTLTVLYGQTRIMFAMSRDGLVPRWDGKLSPRQTPALITATFGILVAIIAAFVPLSEIAKLVNIGTLFAFLIVNIGVIVLRRTAPDMERSFRVPIVPLFPIIGGRCAST